MNDLTTAVGGALFLAVLAATFIYIAALLRKPGRDAETAAMMAASRALASDERGWRQAMLAEMEYIPSALERKRFAFGALILVVKDDKWGILGGVLLFVMSFPWDFGMRGIHPVLALPLLVVGVGGWSGRSWPACARVGLWCGVAAGLLLGLGGAGFVSLTNDNPTLAGSIQTGIWMWVSGSASGFLVGVAGSTVGLLTHRIVRRDDA